MKHIGTYIPDKERRVMREHPEFIGRIRCFILFDDTLVSEGGWCGRKWMSAKLLLEAEKRWVIQSYKTQAGNILKNLKSIKQLPSEFRSHLVGLKRLDDDYDLSAGAGQCGGCSWLAAFDADYGMCCNEKSPNDGRVVFEHGGCIFHSFICEKLGIRNDND